MFRPRVMPCLLLANGGFVKTVKFKKPTYIGDPINVINIFNKLMADEIILLDIYASVEKRRPSFDVIEELAEECTAPLCYGGGLNSLDDIRRVFEIGVEKVILNSALAENPELLQEASDAFGSQAVVVSIDVKKTMFKGYQVYAFNGKKPLKIDPVTYAKQVAKNGAGEIFINSIDRDGTMTGYDIDLIKSVSNAVDIPVIACGGAGQQKDLALSVKHGDCSASAAGSIFVFRSTERGVLINFPTQNQLEELFS